MLPQISRVTKLAFGPFEFDPATGDLRKHGHKVRLSSQPARVLSALLERPGDLLAREALRNRLWPGVSSGDFEHGLNAAVNKLRQALGDAANQQRYVETLPGRGYRFVVPTSRVRPPVLEFVPAAATSGPKLEATRRGFRRWAVGGTLLA